MLLKLGQLHGILLMWVSGHSKMGSNEETDGPGFQGSRSTMVGPGLDGIWHSNIHCQSWSEDEVKKIGVAVSQLYVANARKRKRRPCTSYESVLASLDLKRRHCDKASFSEESGHSASVRSVQIRKSL